MKEVKKELPFGCFYFFEDYVIGELKEGILLDKKLNKEMIDLCLDHYSTKSFVYISNRMQSYAVDPMIYLQCSRIKQLKGIAVVAEKESQRLNTAIEKHFFQKPFEAFESLTEAKIWVSTLN
ncbi:STAS/SEC14 domain-containing protein [Gangjinia marincola]